MKVYTQICLIGGCKQNIIGICFGFQTVSWNPDKRVSLYINARLYVHMSFVIKKTVSKYIHELSIMHVPCAEMVVMV